MRFIRYFTIRFAILLAVAFAPTFVLEVSAAGGFSVSPILPENQVTETTSFFDILVTPGQQEIAILINNTRDEPITVEIDIFSPATSNNGSIDYTSSGRNDESMQYSFEDIARLTTGREVTIPANSSEIVPVIMDIPSGGFDGIIMGSIYTLLGITPEEEAAAGMIVNRFAFAMPVRLRGNNYTDIEANFLIGNIDIQTVNHRASIVADIRNPQPRLVSGALVSAQVYQAGSDTAIFEVSNMNVDFAPNTIFPLTMQDQAGTGVPGGDYIINVQIELDGRTWDFEEDFHIEPMQAAIVNEAALNQVQLPPEQVSHEQFPLWMFAVGAGVVILLVSAAVFFVVSSNKARRKEIELLKKKLEEVKD